MSCTGTSKEQNTCQVEKFGCTGCYFNAPQEYNGMKLIAEYPNHVVYEKEIKDSNGNVINTYRESFQKYDLGERTGQIKEYRYERYFPL